MPDLKNAILHPNLIGHQKQQISPKKFPIDDHLPKYRRVKNMKNTSSHENKDSREHEARKIPLYAPNKNNIIRRLPVNIKNKTSKPQH